MVMAVRACRGAEGIFLIRDLSQVLAVICEMLLMAAKRFITASDIRGLRWRAVMERWRMLWNYILDEGYSHPKPICCWQIWGSNNVVNTCGVCLQMWLEYVKTQRMWRASRPRTVVRFPRGTSNWWTCLAESSSSPCGVMMYVTDQINLYSFFIMHFSVPYSTAE